MASPYICRVTHLPKPFICLFFFLFQSAAFVHADEALKHRVSVFTGQFSTQAMGDTAKFFPVEYESNYLFAVAYSRDMLDLGHGFTTGPEIGTACRFGHRWSVEVWGGVALRHQGLIVADRVRIAPALTFGLSAVDKAIGIERTRQDTQDGDATLLFYLGPELAFSMPSSPQWEVIVRLHHRSGGYRTLGNLKGGHNANTIGIRYVF